MSYAPYISAYDGSDQHFDTWHQVANFPRHNFFQNNPLNKETTIDARRAGYNPYGVGVRVSEIENIHNDGSVYTVACDIIFPVNKNYVKNRTIVTQP